MLTPETLASGAPRTCPDCNVGVVETVCMSEAGYYVGTQCSCGPYTRESGYYKTRAEAEFELKAGGYGR